MGEGKKYYDYHLISNRAIRLVGLLLGLKETTITAHFCGSIDGDLPRNLPIDTTLRTYYALITVYAACCLLELGR